MAKDSDQGDEECLLSLPPTESTGLKVTQHRGQAWS